MSEATIRRGFVDVDEGQIHYRACGAASNPVLVMVHGSPGGSRALVPLMEVLGESFRIYAPDTLGNADSSPATTDKVDIPYLADGLLRALDGAARMLKTSRSELLRWAAERCLAEAIVRAVPVARSKDASPRQRLAALKIIRQSALAVLVRRLPREERDELREGLSKRIPRNIS